MGGRNGREDVLQGRHYYGNWWSIIDAEIFTMEYRENILLDFGCHLTRLCAWSYEDDWLLQWAERSFAGASLLWKVMVYRWERLFVWNIIWERFHEWIHKILNAWIAVIVNEVTMGLRYYGYWCFTFLETILLKIWCYLAKLLFVVTITIERGKGRFQKNGDEAVNTSYCYSQPRKRTSLRL